MSECSIVLSSQNKGGRCAPGPQSACTAFAPFPPLLSAASARAHADSQPHSSPMAPGVLPGAFFRCLQTMLVWTVATHTTQAHRPGRPLGSLRGGLRPRGLANGPGGAYLSTVRQGWKCSIPCKFPDSLLRVKACAGRCRSLTEKVAPRSLRARRWRLSLCTTYTLCV